MSDGSCTCGYIIVGRHLLGEARNDTAATSCSWLCLSKCFQFRQWSSLDRGKRKCPASAIFKAGVAREGGDARTDHFPCPKAVCDFLFAECDIKSRMLMFSHRLFRDTQCDTSNFVRYSLYISQFLYHSCDELCVNCQTSWQDPPRCLLYPAVYMKIYSVYLVVFQNIRCICCDMPRYLGLTRKLPSISRYSACILPYYQIYAVYLAAC